VPPTTVHADLGLWTDGVAVGVLPDATEPSLPRFDTRSADEVQGRPFTIFWSFPPPGQTGADRTDRVGLVVDGPAPVTAGLPAPIVAGIEACRGAASP